MSQDATGKVAVVTGGNRGMGLETCRQLARLGAAVVLTSRDPIAGEAAAKGLRDEGLDQVSPARHGRRGEYPRAGGVPG